MAQGSFDWEVVEAAARIGFWPDLISTDLHSGNVDGAVRDLTNVASKFLNAGMPIKEVSPIVEGRDSNTISSFTLLTVHCLYGERES